MLRSMTGFGRSSLQCDNIEFIVEIKTINHRYHDVFIKIPKQISFLEEKIRKFLSKNIYRGRVEVFISIEEYFEDSNILDESLVETYINAIKKLQNEFKINDNMAVSLMVNFPDILKFKKKTKYQEDIWVKLEKALYDAVDILIQMRKQEGQYLKKDLLQKIIYIEEYLNSIDLKKNTVIAEYKHKLETRLKELLHQNIIDENRLALEIAIISDKCSIDEEIVRFYSHIEQFKQNLNIDNPVGKKLDFIVQEMNREINTIASKSNNLNIINNVLEIKNELEKIKEQIQNIE